MNIVLVVLGLLVWPLALVVAGLIGLFFAAVLSAVFLSWALIRYDSQRSRSQGRGRSWSDGGAVIAALGGQILLLFLTVGICAVLGLESSTGGLLGLDRQMSLPGKTKSRLEHAYELAEPGTSEGQIRTELGPPTRVRGTVWIYAFHGEGRCLFIRIENGVVVGRRHTAPTWILDRKPETALEAREVLGPLWSSTSIEAVLGSPNRIEQTGDSVIWIYEFQDAPLRISLENAYFVRAQ